MPTQNSAPNTRRSAAIAGFVCASLLFAAGTVRAAGEQSSSGDLFSTVFSTYGIAIIFALLVVGLIVFKKVRAAKQAEFVQAERRARARESYLKPPAPAPALLDDVNQTSQQMVPRPERAVVSDMDNVAFGAYRIDQEVAKLVAGKPHRMDVMSSRSLEDRRATEASLIKIINSSDSDDDARRRAQQALEEYGFVARQSASMLMGRDAWERSSAARTLGQIGSQSSLPFLIEALHDTDSVVRNQAVVSLGSLKQPAAIGALLDIARRHPDIPASLLSETLSACSVDSLGYLDSPSSGTTITGDAGTSTQHRDMESFVVFEDLPEGVEDESLTDVLANINTADEKVRTQMVQELALHPVQRSVSALSSMALRDSDPAVRAAAVLSLGSIDHESVFAPVMVALADESREVRAAAARTLSGLHFDRADAYNRVAETADKETLKAVAAACVKIGIAGQAVNRLASEDRRQAFEAFSLFTLLAKANETQPVLDAIENHSDTEVRLCAVRVLNVAGSSEIAPKLRELVASGNIPENVRTAMLEVLYKLDQSQPVFD